MSLSHNPDSDLTAEEIILLLRATGPSPLDAMTDDEVGLIGGAPAGTYETMQTARAKLQTRLAHIRKQVP